MVLATRPGRRKTIDSLVQQQRLQPAADAIVAANYLLALLFIPGLPGTFQVYLLVGGVCWVAAAARSHALHVACDFASSHVGGAACASSVDASRAPLRHGAAGSDLEDLGSSS